MMQAGRLHAVCSLSEAGAAFSSSEEASRSSGMRLTGSQEHLTGRFKNVNLTERHLNNDV